MFQEFKPLSANSETCRHTAHHVAGFILNLTFTSSIPRHIGRENQAGLSLVKVGLTGTHMGHSHLMISLQTNRLAFVTPHVLQARK